ncbi:MAG: DNA-directed RNA polymerase subunit L [Nanoarchaeota archaeon]|nr:DNA-directed RNA polymerase subunit L [Nanoarchaeota archaeon]
MVEIEILEEEKNKLKFKVKGETHTILNLIRNELFNDESIEFAGYKIEHPLVKDAIFTIATSKGTPKTALKKAIERLQKKLSKLEAEIKKL